MATRSVRSSSRAKRVGASPARAQASSKTLTCPSGSVGFDKKNTFDHMWLAVVCSWQTVVFLFLFCAVLRAHVRAPGLWASFRASVEAAVRVEADLQMLVGVGIAGFVAQLVDGSLGMGYGLTSSSVLVAAGVAPSTASASVHLAQLGTTCVSGLAHHRYGNVNGPVTRTISVSGAVGAFVGATLLSSLPVKAAKPIAGGLLFAVGSYVLFRFYRSSDAPRAVTAAVQPSSAFLIPLGLVGGFVDATGGGGWGPVATSGLLADGRLAPARVIGSVSASEFFVTVAAVLAFMASLGVESDGVRPELVLVLLGGGLVAAPIAPLLVQYFPSRLLGVVIGGFICATNLRVLLAAAHASSKVWWAAYGLLTAGWLALIAKAAARALRAASGV